MVVIGFNGRKTQRRAKGNREEKWEGRDAGEKEIIEGRITL